MMEDLDLAGVAVSRETMAELERFAGLVQKWSPKINLVSARSLDDIWQRHVVDSVQLYRFAPDRFDHWVDLGSGAGFPGVVMALLSKRNLTESRFTLIESDQRKAAFLRTAIREFGLNAVVLSERIEAVAPLGANVVSARALAALDQLLELSARHLGPDGICLFPKGRRAEDEIAAARKLWSFDLDDQQSRTDPEGRILKIERISRD